MEKVRLVAYVTPKNKSYLGAQVKTASATVNGIVDAARAPQMKWTLEKLQGMLPELIEKYGTSPTVREMLTKEAQR